MTGSDDLRATAEAGDPREQQIDGHEPDNELVEDCTSGDVHIITVSGESGWRRSMSREAAQGLTCIFRESAPPSAGGSSEQELLHACKPAHYFPAKRNPGLQREVSY